MSAAFPTDDATVVRGILRDVYGELKNLVPEWLVVADRVAFAESEMVGNQFVEPVALSGEHGVTYTTLGAGAINLAAAVPMNIQQAKLDPPQMYEQCQLELGMISRSMKQGDKAIASLVTTVVTQAMICLRRRLEIALINGSVGLGVCASSANQSTTSTLITVQTASWAPGIWDGAENVQLQIYNGNTLIGATVQFYTVSGVNLDNQTLLVTNSNTTDLAALDTAIAGNPNVLTIWFNTAKSGATVNEMIGLHAIVGNTGTLFNINAASYGLWLGNIYDCQSTSFTKQKLGQAVTKAYNKGAMGRLVCLVSGATWDDLEAEVAPLRVFDSSYTPNKGEQGVEKLLYHTKTGTIEIVASPFVKYGFAYIFPPDEFKRIGSRDIQAGLPGVDGDAVERVPGTNFLQMPFMTDQGLFTTSPSHCVLVKNIVNGL